MILAYRMEVETSSANYMGQRSSMSLEVLYVLNYLIFKLDCDMPCLPMATYLAHRARVIDHQNTTSREPSVCSTRARLLEKKERKKVNLLSQHSNYMDL